jgi:hypothetical protein
MSAPSGQRVTHEDIRDLASQAAARTSIQPFRRLPVIDVR